MLPRGIGDSAAIETNFSYSNTLSRITGFNKLAGMEIQSYNLVPNNPNINLAGKVLIPNPTVVTIEMVTSPQYAPLVYFKVANIILKGNVHISFSLNGTVLGFGTIPNLTITPGNHQYDFQGKLGDKAMTALLTAIISGGKNTALTVKGNGTEVDGVDIPWLSSPLASLEVTVPIAVSG